MHGGSVAEVFLEAVLKSNQIKRNINHNSFTLAIVVEGGALNCLLHGFRDFLGGCRWETCALALRSVCWQSHVAGYDPRRC